MSAPEQSSAQQPRPTFTAESSSSDEQKSQLSESSKSEEPRKSQVRGSEGPGFLDRLLPLLPGSRQSGQSESSRKEESSQSEPSGSQQQKASGVTSSVKSQKPSPWYRLLAPRRSLREKFGYASAALVAGLTTFAIFRPEGQTTVSPPKPLELNCTSKICDMISEILQIPRRGDDVCKEFFGGVCGIRYFDNHSRFSGEDLIRKTSRLDSIEEQIFVPKFTMFSSMLEKIHSNVSRNVTSSERQMGKFFQSCMNRDPSVNDAREFFFSLMNDLGIPLEFKSFGRQQVLSMLSALVRLSLVWGIENPLLYVELIPVRGTQHFLTKIRTLYKGFDFEKINITIMRTKRQVEPEIIPQPEEMRPKLQKFIEEAHAKYDDDDRALYDKMKLELDVVSPLFSDENKLERKNFNEMLISYISVTEFLQWRQDYLKRASFIKPPHRSNLSVLEKTTLIKWREAITYAVGNHLHLAEDSPVYVDREDICMHMATFLVDPRMHRVFRQFLYIWLLLRFGPWLGSKSEAGACHLIPGSCDYSTGNKETFCFRKVSRRFVRNRYAGWVRIRYSPFFRKMGNFEGNVRCVIFVALFEFTLCAYKLMRACEAVCSTRYSTRQPCLPAAHPVQLRKAVW